MDEKKETTEDKPEKSAEDTGEGSKPKTTQLIDDGNLTAKRMEEAAKELKVENDRHEIIVAESKLSGTAGGHQEVTEKTDEQKKVEGAKEFFKGTALGDDIKKANE